MSANIACESPTDNICVVRFLRPDLYDVLYLQTHEYSNIADCPLYQDLYQAAILGLPESGTLILNFGMVDVFPTAFMRMLFRVKDDMKAKKARLLFCCHTAHVTESYTLIGGPKSFEPVLSTEAEAVRVAKK